MFGLVLGLTGPIATAPTRVAAQSGIVYVGDIGSAASATQQSALVITTTAAVVEGDDIIVAFATYGDPDYTISVTDAAGNTYEQAATSTCYEYGRTYIFAAYDVTALPSGSHITITHTSVNGGTAAVASVFRGLVDVEPLDQSLGNPAAGAQQSASGTTPTVGPTGTTVQAHELVVGAIGTAGPVGDTPGRWAYDFPAGPRAGSTGASNYDWTVSIGYRIVSETGPYTAQKSGITKSQLGRSYRDLQGGGCWAHPRPDPLRKPGGCGHDEPGRLASMRTRWAPVWTSRRQRLRATSLRSGVVRVPDRALA